MSKSIEIYKSRINKVIDFVNENLDRAIPLDELAEVAYFSPYHFHRIFVAVTGESVNDFTNRVRLEKTARLLRYGKNAIADIGGECGFSSASTFSRAFKQHFGISPSAYRKGAPIENSKIRKELFPVKDYHCNMTGEEIIEKFPITVKDFPDRRVAYIRVLDSYREGVVIKAFEDLVGWAKRADLFDSETIFGMSVDDPMVTPKEIYRYEVCITIPEDFKVEKNDVVETMTLSKCKYAVASVSGTFNEVATVTNYMFNDWIINSDFEPEHQPGMEVFRDKENVCNWEYFELDLCVPVKKIKAY